MKIVILQGAFLPVPPLQGGAVEKIWYRMGQEFAAAGHEVLHIGKSFAALPKTETANGVQYIRVDGYNTPANLVRLKLLDLLYSLRAVSKVPKDADVIVTNTFWSPLLLRGGKGRKVYVSVERVPRGQMKFYTHAGRLRACSPAIYEAIKKELPARRHRLITHVPNPVPFDVRPVQTAKENMLLFVGRLHPEKGVHVLLEAFAQLQQAVGGSWKLVLVGPYLPHEGGGGELYFKSLEELAKGLPVTFTGPVYNDAALTAYYARAKIFCYPAQDGSGDAAPVSPREAMAYGCVPVVSRLDCFSDFIQHGVNGIQYDQQAEAQATNLAAALQQLMQDPLLVDRLSAAAREVCKTYSPAAIAENFLSDFTQMSQHEST